MHDLRTRPGRLLRGGVLALLLGVGAIAPLATLAAPPAAPIPTNPAQPVVVAAGSRFTLVLESNASTGYSWQLDPPADRTHVQLIDNTYYQPPPAAGTPPLAGAPGFELWNFQALAPGQTTVTLHYSRPFDKTTPPAQVVTFTILIQGGAPSPAGGGPPGMPSTGQPAPGLPVLILGGLLLIGAGLLLRRHVAPPVWR
ncbi:MAG TPA: protease inhibitor I42 family protein [Chloroflexia bacterium]|nr:protease inhibitor I42 family protein [Chloroflexia bacterium]